MFRDRTFFVLVSFLAVLTLVLSACTPTVIPGAGQVSPTPSQDASPAVPPTQTEEPGKTPVAIPGGFEEFVNDLEEADAIVVPVEDVDSGFFDVQGQVINVNGEDVQVFEFVTEQERQEASIQISTDGGTIGNVSVRWVDQPNFWAEGRLIVLYLGRNVETINLLMSVLGQPITPHTEATVGGTGQAGQDPSTNPAVAAAVDMVSRITGVPTAEVQVTSAEYVEWTDSCLGAGGPAEMCLLVITPGYNVRLMVGGQAFEVHTNADGSAIRLAQ